MFTLNGFNAYGKNASAPEGIGKNQFETITVTARKIEEDPQKVPRSIGAQYLGVHGLFARVDFFGTDECYGDSGNTSKQNACQLLNLRVRYEWQPFGCSLWLENALDEAYFTYLCP